MWSLRHGWEQWEPAATGGGGRSTGAAAQLRQQQKQQLQQLQQQDGKAGINDLVALPRDMNHHELLWAYDTNTPNVTYQMLQLPLVTTKYESLDAES